MRKINKISGTRTSDRLVGRLADEWSERLWESILGGVARSQSRKEIKFFLESILSDSERKLLLRRLAILALLRSGKSYKEIGRILWVSPQTVSTIKKNFLDKKGQYKSYRKSRPTMKHATRHEPLSSTAIDAIFTFLGIPFQVFEAFFAKGIGVMGDRDSGLGR
ncbi:MAG: Trp family transcriptional regulator [Patescibacteria group bacterium]